MNTITEKEWDKTSFEVIIESPPGRDGSSREWDAQELKFILDEHYTRPVKVRVLNNETR